MTGQKRYTVLVCRGPECGGKLGSEVLQRTLVELLAQRGATSRVTMEWQSCFGRCAQGCNILVKEQTGSAPARTMTLAALPGQGGERSALYGCVEPEDVVRIVEEHILGGRRIRDMMLRPTEPRRPARNRGEK